MGNRLWIENIITTPSFFINFKIVMAGFKDLYKVVVRRSAFSTFSSERNEGELKGKAKSGKLKRKFSQVKGDLNL
jgi:hypothetical protein